jgi:hypothetical protein
MEVNGQQHTLDALPREGTAVGSRAAVGICGDENFFFYICD